MARGATRGRVPNTGIWMGRVKAVAARVMARDSATGRHRLRPRPFLGPRQPSPRLRGAYSTCSPRVAITERAKPRSPPAKGSGRQMQNTAKPREFTPSLRRPKQPDR